MTPVTRVGKRVRVTGYWPGWAVLACAIPWSAVLADAPLRFDFGSGGNAAGSTTYSAARGYGFEPAMDGDRGRRFSIRLPTGNYRVTLRLGARQQACLTTVAAETRRLMLENVSTASGEFVERNIVVNLRTAALARPPVNAPGGSSVRLNLREVGSATWDDKLTLQFIGTTSARAFALPIQNASRTSPITWRRT